MIVTMVAMRVMQVAINEIIHMVAMRNRFVSAAGAMNVTALMSAALVVWCAVRGIGITYFQDVFNDFAILLLVMQVAIMQVVCVAVMFYSGMPASGTVLMIVVLM
ncbi:hypothetical protein CA54_00610 [Symmachiella macrocystis]|uniref:Uncharacterized protein n=1 Tax=Symmachiella macrocystis TaxID=2527985 RepID=A0A5C6BIU3_9PLAN|nr:hypothetical protein [Symmachiella macrocystis]TWU11256.1 hypothetical protein CA54_00610 [Symmachiella macrocystis]